MSLTTEQRLERLERQNRRLRSALLGLGAVIGGAAIMGQASPKGKPDVVRAHAFELVDTSGKMVSRWELSDDATRLRLLSKSGESGITLVAAEGATIVDIMGNIHDNTSVNIGVREGRYAGPFITITRDNDTVFAAPAEDYVEHPPL